jgi:two-component system, OmpR family, phosphate regulon sensor histidine kinase PhoR
VVNGLESRLLALAEASGDLVLLLDADRRLLAASPSARLRFGLVPGQRVQEEVLRGERPPLALYLGEPGPLSAYEELRAGFTAAVSHELRTPLARLLALLETVELPGEDVAGLVEQARHQVDQIRELIDDVLFLGELETGAGVVALGSTRGLAIIREVTDALAEAAARADVSVRVEGAEALELPLRPRMVRVIVENLVENALRYAGPGATLRVSLTRSGNATVLRVVDDGAGVSEDDLPRLFERFYRADRARASRGTGLGLAIVKHVVTAAGGTVEARGGPGRGLEVRAVFPVS